MKLLIELLLCMAALLFCAALITHSLGWAAVAGATGAAGLILRRMDA